MTTLELDDIQGIIRRGYGKMKSAYFILLEIKDAAAARHWLGELVDEGKIRDATETLTEEDTCVNVAFTCHRHGRLLQVHPRLEATDRTDMTSDH